MGGKILIVEDELIIAKDVELTLKNFNYDVIGTLSSADDVLDFLTKKTPDLILMDIRIKGKISGIELSLIIKELYSIPVIFLSAFSDQPTFEKAKKAEPYGYLIKPVKEDDLNSTIQMALYKHKKDVEKGILLESPERAYSAAFADDFIFVKVSNKIVKIHTKDIYFVEALKDYVSINTIDKRYTIHSTMKEIESKLERFNFIRVHRSYIVRIDKISSIEFPNLTLEDDKRTLPIGASYKEELTNKINLL